MFDKVKIQGYQKRPIDNTLFCTPSPSDKLGIVFPGRGYTTKMPLLYYTTSLLSQLEMNVLTVDHNYSVDDTYMNADSDEQSVILKEDILGVDKAIKSLNMIPQVIVGKSLGTRSLALLVQENPDYTKSKVIWMTPILQDTTIEQVIRKFHPFSFFIIGTADPFYNHQILEEYLEITKGERFVQAVANHSMEVPGGVNESLTVMQNLLQKMEDFVKSE